MNLGRVIGNVVTTQKIDSIKGVILYAVEPCDEHLKVTGESFVAADTVGAREGDLVMWVASKEAALALDDPFSPVDATIVGLVDAVG